MALSKPTAQFSRESLAPERTWFAVNRDFLAGPSIGPLGMLHFLLVPDMRVTSLANMDLPHRMRMLDLAERLRETIADMAGPESVVVAEHGSANAMALNSACITQCHLHIIAFPQLAQRMLHHVETEAAEQPVLTVDELRDYADMSYIMLSVQPEGYHVWPHEPLFVRQYLRIVAAKATGKPETWDWKTDTMPERQPVLSKALEVLLQRAQLEHTPL